MGKIHLYITVDAKYRTDHRNELSQLTTATTSIFEGLDKHFLYLFQDGNFRLVFKSFEQAVISSFSSEEVLDWEIQAELSFEPLFNSLQDVLKRFRNIQVTQSKSFFLFTKNTFEIDQTRIFVIVDIKIHLVY